MTATLALLAEMAAMVEQSPNPPVHQNPGRLDAAEMAI
jgi:hypothetical protein